MATRVMLKNGFRLHISSWKQLDLIKQLISYEEKIDG